MKLTINGVITENVKAGTVRELLEDLKVDPDRVAVEVNLTVVRRAAYGQFRLNDGDVVEIVNFVGGGSRCLGLGVGDWSLAER